MALGGALTLAQTAPGIAPLRTAPVEKFTVNPGHRDWAPTVLDGTTIIGGNSSNRGGLFAVDALMAASALSRSRDWLMRGRCWWA